MEVEENMILPGFFLLLFFFSSSLLLLLVIAVLGLVGSAGSLQLISHFCLASLVWDLLGIMHRWFYPVVI